MKKLLEWSEIFCRDPMTDEDIELIVGFLKSFPSIKRNFEYLSKN